MFLGQPERTKLLDKEKNTRQLNTKGERPQKSVVNGIALYRIRNPSVDVT
jgi:hypothetical protein